MYSYLFEPNQYEEQNTKCTVPYIKGALSYRNWNLICFDCLLLLESNFTR